MTEQQITALTRIGSRWRKNGMDRIYFNDLPKLLGLECTFYGTGNVSNAFLNGERVSNSDGRRILGRLAGAKVYYDVTADKFMGRDIQQDDFDAIVAAIKAQIAEEETACIA